MKIVNINCFVLISYCLRLFKTLRRDNFIYSNFHFKLYSLKYSLKIFQNFAFFVLLSSRRFLLSWKPTWNDDIAQICPKLSTKLIRTNANLWEILKILHTVQYIQQQKYFYIYVNRKLKLSNLVRTGKYTRSFWQHIRNSSKSARCPLF